MLTGVFVIFCCFFLLLITSCSEVKISKNVKSISFYTLIKRQSFIIQSSFQTALIINHPQYCCDIYIYIYICTLVTLLVDCETRAQCQFDLTHCEMRSGSCEGQFLCCNVPFGRVKEQTECTLTGV